MAKKKKKKKKVLQNQYNFSDIISSYTAGEYKKALALTKKAKVVPEEVGKEKQLKAEINHRLAYDLFCECRFDEAIATLENNFKVQPRKDFPIDLDKSWILCGLSHLYLGNFSQAAADIGKAAVSEQTIHFHFYKILAELYAGKYSDMKDVEAFELSHPEYFKQTEPVKKQYLQAVFYLFKDDEENFRKIISSIKPESHFQHQNLQALLSIVEAKPADIVKNDRIKPLYKIFVGIAPDSHERIYLAHFEVLKKYLNVQERKKKSINLKEEIGRLCDEGVPMLQSSLEAAMADARLAAFHSRIVYNQVAVLFNKGVEKKESPIHSLIRKYRKEFFRVPESVFLYFHFVKQEEIRESPEFFYDVVEFYLKEHAGALSSGQLNAVGWHMFDSFLANPGLGSSKIAEKRITSLMQSNPEMIGLKLWVICSYAFGTMPAMHPASLNIFILPGLQDEGEKIQKRIKEMLESLRPETGLLSSLMHNKDEVRLYKQTVEKLTIACIKAASHTLPEKNAKVILSLFKLIQGYLKDLMVSQQQDVPRQVLHDFQASYQQLLETCRESSAKSSYTREYRALVFLKESATLQRKLNKPKPGSLREEYISLISKGFEEELITYLSEVVHQSDYNPALNLAITELISIYVIDFGDSAEEKVTRLVKGLHEKKPKIAWGDYRRRMFLTGLTDLLIKKFNQAKFYRTNYLVAHEFVDEIIAYEVPDHYNLAGRLLTFMMKVLRASPDFAYDKVFIEKLLNYLSMVLKRRKLKGLKKIYVAANDFFRK